MSVRLMTTLIFCIVLTGAAEAHHKAGHQIPPGHMKKMLEAQIVIPDEVQSVCLVTTAIAGDPYARVISSRWLPRAEAEAEANLGDSFIIYHPDLNTEAGCLNF